MNEKIRDLPAKGILLINENKHKAIPSFLILYNY